jgi:hypothetical protein
MVMNGLVGIRAAGFFDFSIIGIRASHFAELHPCVCVTGWICVMTVANGIGWDGMA